MAAIPHGPEISATENALSAILYPLQWAVQQNRPSSAAFDEELFSVDIASRSTPEATAARFRNVLRVVQFNCGQARAIGFDTRDELDLAQPDNPAHAHVYFVGASKRKTQARKLSELCITVYPSS